MRNITVTGKARPFAVLDAIAILAEVFMPVVLVFIYTYGMEGATPIVLGLLAYFLPNQALANRRQRRRDAEVLAEGFKLGKNLSIAVSGAKPVAGNVSIDGMGSVEFFSEDKGNYDLAKVN